MRGSFNVNDVMGEMPALNLNAITAAGVTPLARNNVLGGGGTGQNFDFDRFNELFTIGHPRFVPESNRFHGHVVINLGTDNMPMENMQNKTFNGRVIFIAESGQYNVNNTFYNSAAGSNTVIIMRNGSRIVDFGVRANQTFRGLFYVEPGNSAQQSFKFSQNSTFDGAMLMRGDGNLMWNNADDGNVNVKFNPDVLNSIGNLAPFNVGFEAGADTAIDFNAFGYYYF